MYMNIYVLCIVCYSLHVYNMYMYTYLHVHLFAAGTVSMHSIYSYEQPEVN
jgi:hypothetical protein